MLNPQDSAWEASIVAAVTVELEQLRYLVEDKSGSTEEGNIHALKALSASGTGALHVTV